MIELKSFEKISNLLIRMIFFWLKPDCLMTKRNLGMLGKKPVKEFGLFVLKNWSFLHFVRLNLIANSLREKNFLRLRQESIAIFEADLNWALSLKF